MAKDPTEKQEASGSLADLSGPQVNALCVLASGGRKAEAARAAGVHPQRVSEWLRAPQFKRALADAREELVSQAIGELSALTRESLAALHDLLAGGPASVRFRVATYVLDRVLMIDSAGVPSPPYEVDGEAGLSQLFEALGAVRHGD